ncbi:tetratricopeptide repeat protein [Phenylobacterium sp.]|jgi:tetratricopeptide (TPR) repeat protein|uniref:tetratricopeptide repeat protein n=1 Tax=Phenylobacterium sp. TaxID=1871053 RepID=UPI002F9370BA
MPDGDAGARVRRRRASKAPRNSDPVDIALEAAASGESPSAAAMEVLRANAALLRQQVTLARNEVFRNRIRAVRDGALAALVVAVVAGAGGFLWKARAAEGLVVEPIRVPKALADQGLDGVAVSSRLLDRLSAMQAATDSSRAPSTFNDDWSQGLAVEVPQTGVSVGELWTFLKRTIGHETRLTGEVVQTASGLALTTRLGATPGVTLTGSELDPLLDQAAQAVFRGAQPYRYSVWLRRVARKPGEADALLLELAESPDKMERLWAMVGLSTEAAVQNRGEAAEAYAREGLRFDQTFEKLRWNLKDALEVMGRDEELLKEARVLQPILRRRDPRVTDASQALVRRSTDAVLAHLAADYQTAAGIYEAMSRMPEYSGNAAFAPYDQSEALLKLHDVTAADQVRLAADRSARPDVQGSAYLRLLIEDARGNPAAARDPATLAAALTPGFGLPMRRRELAPVLARAGDVESAEALLAGSRADCIPCAVARAEIAVSAGRPANADRWFAQAVHLGPSLPTAAERWAEAKLARGDLDGALTLFRQAQKTGPRWADPLKGEGDVLARRGDWGGAARLYAKAAERAPRWGALYVAWGQALAKLGKTDEAQATWRAAAGMDLTPAEQAKLATASTNRTN